MTNIDCSTKYVFMQMFIQFVCTQKTYWDKAMGLHPGFNLNFIQIIPR